MCRVVNVEEYLHDELYERIYGHWDSSDDLQLL